MAISRAGAPVQSRPNYEGLIARAKQVPPGRTVVVHPCDETSLRGVAEAAASGIIVPILIGPAAKITASSSGATTSSWSYVQSLGFLSVRHLRNCAVWRNRFPCM